MTQISRPQQGRLVTYPDAGGYTANQWARVFRLLVHDPTTQGVFGGYISEMAVTNPAGQTIRVASGAALVNGHYCFNEDQTDPAVASNVDFAPTTPGADRIDRVVLVQNNTDAVYDGTVDYGAAVLEFPTDLTDYAGLSSVPAHSCRLAILTGVSGAAMRALTQDVAVAGNIWMIEIARYTITNAPAISVGPTDYRDLINERTRRFFVPAIHGINITDGGIAITQAYLATAYIAGYPLSHLNKVTLATGRFAIPSDFVSDISVEACVVGSQSGNVYARTIAVFGADTEATTINNVSTAYAAHTLAAADTRYLIDSLSLAGAAIGDMVDVLTWRDSSNVADTIADSVWCLGWLVSYTADS